MTRGKWKQPSVPHKGWSCVDIGDLGEPEAICEMCETQEIRFVHYMEHPDYSMSLGVGCVCAQHMEQDYKAPQKRERALRNTAARRRRWITRSWSMSVKANDYLNTDGFNIIIFRRGRGWSFRISIRSTGWSRSAKKVFETQDKAKLAAFDAMIYLKDRQSYKK